MRDLNPMKTAFDLELKPTAAVIRTAREATRALAPDVPPGKLEDLRLLVSELVTNSVRHGRFNPGDCIRLKLSLDNGTIRVEVLDPGAAFQAPAAPGPSSESGWGMYLVEELADRWGITHNDEVCVWFEIDV